MVVSTQGSGDRSLFVSYISEVPVWKATYRIVLNAKGADHLLQGWAIVDNTTGQDWRNIHLSLVAGAPQSFIQNLSQPYYSRRPVVPLPESVLNSPQTFESTLVPGSARLTGTIHDASGAVIADATVRAIASGARAGETRTDASGRYEFQSLPDGPVQVQVEARGFQHMVVNNVMIAAGRDRAAGCDAASRCDDRDSLGERGESSASDQRFADDGGTPGRRKRENARHGCGSWGRSRW